MADRTRLLVAHLLGGRARNVVDVLRQILASSEIGRIAPHLTLIAPVNVARARVADLCRTLEEAVTTVAPVQLSLSGIATFPPLRHVLYLPVTGDLAQLESLRDRCRVAEFAAHDERPFVAHVTVKSHASQELVASAPSVLGAFECPLTVDRVAILERDLSSPSGIWEIRDEFVLGSSSTAGRGGREVTCCVTTHVSRDDQHFFVGNGVDLRAVVDHRGSRAEEMMLIRARVNGELVGLCALCVREGEGEIVAFAVDAQHRRQGIGRQIVNYLERCADDLSIDTMTVTVDAAMSGFFLHCGFGDASTSEAARAKRRLTRELFKPSGDRFEQMQRSTADNDEKSSST